MYQKLVMGAYLGTTFTGENVAQKAFQFEEELSAHAGFPTGQVPLEFPPILVEEEFDGAKAEAAAFGQFYAYSRFGVFSAVI